MRIWTQIGGRGHGGDVTGIEDIGAGARGTRALRCNEGGHRHRRGDDLLDDLAHGGVQSARGIHFQHHQLRVLVGSRFQATYHIVGRSRADGAVDVEYGHQRGGRRYAPSQAGEQEQSGQQSVSEGWEAGMEGRQHVVHLCVFPGELVLPL